MPLLMIKLKNYQFPTLSAEPKRNSIRGIRNSIRGKRNSIRNGIRNSIRRIRKSIRPDDSIRPRPDINTQFLLVLFSD